MQTIPDFVDPILADKVVQNINDDFQVNLTWLAYRYPIVRVGVHEEYTYPRVYANDGSNRHYDIRPDEDAPSYSFFEQEGSYTINDEGEDADYSLSLVVWFRLDKVDSGKEYDYTSELISAVLERLKFLGAREIEVFTNPEDVFDKYSGLEQLQSQNLMQPNSGFKISFTIKGDTCTEGFTDSGVDQCPPDHIPDC